jgi:DNA-binding MarR family transcriptional regulator
MRKIDKLSALDSHVGYWMRLVSNHVSQAFQRKVETKGVTVAEWVILRTLFETGEVPPSRIAEILGLTRGAVSKLVARLAKKRLLLCRGERSDKRFQAVGLTGAGRRLVPVLARLADQNDAECFEGMSAQEQRELKTLLRGLVDRQGWRSAPLQ